MNLSKLTKEQVEHLQEELASARKAERLHQAKLKNQLKRYNKLAQKHAQLETEHKGELEKVQQIHQGAIERESGKRTCF